MTTTPTSAASSAAFYPTPAFQNHIEQLEQEYDAPPDMVDDSELETSGGPGPYPSGFGNDCNPPMMLSPASNGPGHQLTHAEQFQSPQVSGQQYSPSMTQLMDPTTNWGDPFGLTASMTFPTQQYQFDQSSMR